MSDKSHQTHRLFVAAYPPLAIAEEMQRALSQLDIPDHKKVPVDKIHLTIHFIGDTSKKEMEHTIESVERSQAGLKHFDLAPTQLISLPKRGHSRLIACETDSPSTLLEIHHRLVTRLAHKPHKNKNSRYLPHLTLCRFRKPVKLPSTTWPIDIGPFPIDNIKLMRSILKPEGAQHLCIEEFHLK